MAGTGWAGRTILNLLPAAEYAAVLLWPKRRLGEESGVKGRPDEGPLLSLTPGPGM